MSLKILIMSLKILIMSFEILIMSLQILIISLKLLFLGFQFFLLLFQYRNLVCHIFYHIIYGIFIQKCNHFRIHTDHLLRFASVFCDIMIILPKLRELIDQCQDILGTRGRKKRKPGILNVADTFILQFFSESVKRDVSDILQPTFKQLYPHLSPRLRGKI